MTNTSQLPNWYEAETEVHNAVDALEHATKAVAALLADPITAHFIKTRRDGDVLASRARLGNIVWEITGGKQV
jgi:hypothetical protein